MSLTHIVGYSQSARAKCHGPPPCQGANIEKGSLRYGRKITADYGDTIEWRHWECVTPDILAQLAMINPSQIKDFTSLNSDDQHKIVKAIQERRIPPLHPPAAALPPPLPPLPIPTPPLSMSQTAPSQKQRKASRDAALATAAASSQPPTAVTITPHPMAHMLSGQQPPPPPPPALATIPTIPHPVATSATQSLPSQKQRKAMRDAALAANASQAPRVVPATIAKPPSLKKRKHAAVASTPTPASAGSSSSQALVEPENESVEDEPMEELYATLRINVVGVQYYKGLVGPGEEVILQREPHNKYDSNAIQVLNMNRIQVGHIPRGTAVKLAPLMDRNLVNCEAVIHDGNLSGFKGYTLDLTVRIYGRSDKRRELEPVLKWATPGQRGFAPQARPPASQAGPSYSTGMGRSAPAPAPLKHVTKNTQAQIEAAMKQEESRKKAAELSRILNTLEKVDDEGRRNSLLDTVCSTEDVLKLPLHPDPPGITKGDLLVDLMKHQSQGLQWCIEREYPKLPQTEKDPPVQFWQVRKNPSKNSNYYFNIATKTPTMEAPALGRGALFADAMGLGKTLTMIALVLATKADKPAQFCNSTLIVVPLSILSNWEKQMLDHCAPGALTSYVYYGAGRSIAAEDLSRYDVVLTTYQVCVTEFADVKPEAGPKSKKKKMEKALYDIKWKRIILDEGHTVRNPKTKMAKAVCGLEADRRWVLTGTPIINSPRDLGSILTFLRICRPLNNEEYFKRLLLRPLKDGHPDGAQLLSALMSHVCIRRTKEMQDSNGTPLIPLPPVEIIRVPVVLHDEARQLYDEIEKLSQQRIQGYLSRGEANSITSNVLSMLTRMRQIALHPGLVPKDYIDQLKAMLENDDPNKPQITLSPADKSRLQSRLLQAIEDYEECPVCLCTPETNNARITACSHLFCISCITEILSRQGKCPMDRRVLSIGDVIEPPPPTEMTQMMYREEEESTFQVGSSAKIDQLIHLLTLMPGSEKSLVFSQFTSFLDKIAEALDERGISYERFDGRMSAKKRQEVLARFSVPIAEAPIVDDDAMDVEPATSRRRKASRRAVMDDDDDDNFAPTRQDSDFTPMGQDDDDDFIVSDDDDSYSTKKSKGKGKAKAKGKGKARDPSPERLDDLSFGNGGNPKILLLSLKAGALGLNLTVANNVFMMDPWWQEGIESQAIDRVNRIGQKKDVHVYQLIAENTVEAKVLDIQEKKKTLIAQAFSGQKRTETPHQRKEARLQEIIELFGMRNSQMPASST